MVVAHVHARTHGNTLPTRALSRSGHKGIISAAHNTASCASELDTSEPTHPARLIAVGNCPTAMRCDPKVNWLATTARIGEHPWRSVVARPDLEYGNSKCDSEGSEQSMQFSGQAALYSKCYHNCIGHPQHRRTDVNKCTTIQFEPSPDVLIEESEI